MLKWVSFFGVNAVIQVVQLLILRRLKGFQNIYELSPKSHQLKGKTPSFGGIGIAIAVVLGAVWFVPLSPSIVWLLGLFVSFSLLGLVDDLMGKVFKRNQGLNTKQKFILQWVVAAMWVFALHLAIIPLSAFQSVFYAFVIVASCNATNLTDGLDGLMTGLALISLCGFMWVFETLGLVDFMTLIRVVVVALIVFLFFNKHPAKIFMGDTGSMGLGALLSGLAFLAGNPWLLLPFGLIYIVETLSVMIQVTSYKLRKKRVFLMSPIHHHFELLGMPEQKVVALFWAVQAVAVVGYILV